MTSLPAFSVRATVTGVVSVVPTVGQGAHGGRGTGRGAERPVVRGQDLLVGQALQRIAERAPLAHAAPRAVAVAGQDDVGVRVGGRRRGRNHGEHAREPRQDDGGRNDANGASGRARSAMSDGTGGDHARHGPTAVAVAHAQRQGRLRWRDHGPAPDGPASLSAIRLDGTGAATGAALAPSGGMTGLPPQVQLSVVYETLLGRKPDPSGMASYLPGLQDGSLSPSQLAEWIYASSEWWTVAPFTQLAPALHFSRSLFVRSLPKARRILDLGGTALGSDKGAMVLMGYPYAFDELVVVDLPPDDRNDLYKETVARNVTQTELGPVHYRYHSMSDLTQYADELVRPRLQRPEHRARPGGGGRARPGRGGEDPSPRRLPRPRHAQRAGVPAPAARVHRSRSRPRVHPRRDDGQAARRRVRGPRSQGPQPRRRARWPEASSRCRRWPPSGGCSPRSRTAISSAICAADRAER